MNEDLENEADVDLVEKAEVETSENTETVDNVDNVTETQEVADSENNATEEEVHTYSQEDVDNILQARTNSLNRKHQKELDKYRKAESILKQGLGVDTIDDINSQLAEFYKGQGVEIKEDSNLNDRDERVLASADVKEIISFGDEEMMETAQELANKKNRTVREEAVLNGLMKEIGLKRATQELTKMGADKSIYESDGFKTFASQFNPNVQVTEIYNLYTKTLPTKKQPESAGSMKSTPVGNEVKDFYTAEEAKKFTAEDFDRNPALEEAVIRSMYSGKWKN